MIIAKTNNSNQQLTYGLLLLILSIALTLPWLGLGHFYTRGEPREALVAMAMMEQGNFILPTFQGEIAFKPPMLHWLVSLCSLPIGHITEYTARMPSAVASIAMTLAFFAFCAKRVRPEKAFVASLLMITCFEVHRAAMTCRVDMVLMAFTVGSLLAMLRWAERGYRGLPLWAAILASGAILTKGPIGAILPCFTLLVYMLLCGKTIGQTAIAIIKLAVLSAIIPAVWYAVAYRQGGDKFIALVMEENFGRFLGKMTYESHENGLFYYIPILLSGLIPYSLLLIPGLFLIKYRRICLHRQCLAARWNRFRNMDRTRLFAIVAAACIFIFYCIPKSKRSVYLLPMYPFMSLIIADYLEFLFKKHKKILSGYAVFISALAFIYSAAFFVVRAIDPTLLGTSRSARRMIMQLSELQAMPMDGWYFICALLPTIAAAAVLTRLNRKWAAIWGSMLVWTAMNITLDSVLNPAIKNSVPDYEFAMVAKGYQPDGKVFMYRPEGSKEETVYTAAFYLDDKIANYSEGDQLPAKGYIMVREPNIPRLESALAQENYDIREVYRTKSEFTSFRGNLMLYEFRKKTNGTNKNTGDTIQASRRFDTRPLPHPHA